MADNITAKANTGSGTEVLAAKDIGGVLFPKSIIVDGSGNEVAPASSAGQTTGNASLSSIDGKLDDQATAALQTAGNASLTAIEGFFKSEDTAAASGDKGLVMLAQRFAADTPTTDADGDYTILKLDEEGRLKVSTKPASYADITGDITAVQATIGTPVAGGTVAGDVSRASNIMIFCTGTFAGVNCTFEGSLQDTGDTNWFAVQAVRSNANTIELTTGALSAQPAYAWEASVNALKRFRVRCTARTSGTQSWRFVQGTYATEPIPAAQVSATQPVSGTVTATVALATKTATTQTAKSALNDNLFTGTNGTTIWYDATAFSSGAVTIVGGAGISGGAIIFEGTNDSAGVGVPIPVAEDNLGYNLWVTTAQSIAASSIRNFSFPIKFRYIRARISTAFTGGTISCLATFSQQPYTATSFNVTQNSGGYLQVAASASTPFALSIEASSAKTVVGTTAGAAQANLSALGAIFAINVSAASGTAPTLAVKIQAQDPVSLNWLDIPGAVTSSITTTGLYSLTLYPGAAQIANSSIAHPLPRTYRAAWTIGGTSPSFTFSIGAIYMQ